MASCLKVELLEAMRTWEQLKGTVLARRPEESSENLLCGDSLPIHCEMLVEAAVLFLRDVLN